jgi:two-component system response regulator RegX3
MQTILVIDDDENLRDTIAVLLSREGFQAILAADGKTGLDQAIFCKPALILTDLCLPVLSGIELCKRLRATGIQTPIIALTALSAQTDKVLLLEIGADDYVVKPFSIRELMARIRAVLRRVPGEQDRIISFADTNVDIERRIVTRRGEEVKLSAAEYNLLTYFLHNSDRPLSRDLILTSVWGYQSCLSTRTVDAHVARLRQKLEADPSCPRHFLTLHRLGYRFLP